MYGRFGAHLALEFEAARALGHLRTERVIVARQGVEIELADGRRVLNFCSNDYLGLADEPWVNDEARRALAEHGVGVSSTRQSSGTHAVHRTLEAELAAFVGAEAALLFSSCYAANLGFFSALFGPQDVVCHDELCHASILDGIRLSGARAVAYRHASAEDLEAKLHDAARARFRAVATDGVFPADGDVAPLPALCAAAERHEALLYVDDAHATGIAGASGRGTAELLDVAGRVDVLSGTLSKCLGGSNGGFVAARREVVEALRQRARTYLFSNSIPPLTAATSLAILRRLAGASECRERLEARTRAFREGMAGLGFDIRPGGHPIVSVMIYEAALAQRFAADLLDRGILVMAQVYPVVPQGEARLRVQVSAAHRPQHIERAMAAFREAGRRHGIL